MKEIDKSRPWQAIGSFALGILVGMITLKGLASLPGGDDSREVPTGVQAPSVAVVQQDLDRRRETEKLTRNITDLTARLAEAEHENRDLENRASTADGSNKVPPISVRPWSLGGLGDLLNLNLR